MVDKSAAVQSDQLPLLDRVSLRPAYSGLTAAYLLGFTAFLGLLRRSGRRLPEYVPPADLALVAIATYKLSAIVTRERVASPIRAPFTHNDGAPPKGRSKPEPRGRGLRRTLGELLTCPYCTSAWIAAGLTYGIVLAPKPTRVFVSIFSSVTLSDFLTFAFQRLQRGSSPSARNG